jgi:hypothetical protein
MKREGSVAAVVGERTWVLGPQKLWDHMSRLDRALGVFSSGGEIRFGNIPEVVEALSDYLESSDSGADVIAAAQQAVFVLTSAARLQTAVVIVQHSL